MHICGLFQSLVEVEQISEEASVEPMLMYKDRFLFSNWPLRGSYRQIQSSVPLLKQNQPAWSMKADKLREAVDLLM